MQLKSGKRSAKGKVGHRGGDTLRHVLSRAFHPFFRCLVAICTTTQKSPFVVSVARAFSLRRIPEMPHVENSCFSLRSVIPPAPVRAGRDVLEGKGCVVGNPTAKMQMGRRFLPPRTAAGRCCLVKNSFQQGVYLTIKEIFT